MTDKENVELDKKYSIKMCIRDSSLFLYIATMPIIVLSWRKQKGYLIGAIAAFVYGLSLIHILKCTSYIIHL